MLSFIDFEASFVILFNDKVSKNAPKHEKEGLINLKLFSNQLFFANFFQCPIVYHFAIISTPQENAYVHRQLFKDARLHSFLTSGFVL